MTHQETGILPNFIYYYMFCTNCHNNTMYTKYSYDVLQTMYFITLQIKIT